MAGWNYRVLRRVLKGHNYTEDEYSVHEVYYDPQGNPTSCSVDPQAPHGETMEELHADLERYTEALAKPTLDYDAIVANGKPTDD